MLRTALRPRWLSLLALVLVVDVAFAFLGLWQLSVARDEGAKEALEAMPHRDPVPVETVLTPHTPFPGGESNRPVTVTGHYLADGQVLVAGRRLDDASGYWVVTPLKVRGSDATIAVLRGFVTEPRASAPSSTDVTVSGTLAPGESAADPRVAVQPGQLASLDLGQLVNRWDGQLYNAFVFAQTETPNATDASIARVPTPGLPSHLSGRNLAYAFQWWIFALFATWMWWKMVKDEYRRERHPTGTAADPAVTDTTTGAPT